MATTVTEQIVREAPEIEAIKLALLQDAQQLSGTPVDLPDYQVADFSDLQRVAQDRAITGIGGYEAYLDRAAGLLGEARAPAAASFGLAEPLISGGVQAGTALMQSGAGAATGEGIAQYMNPFQQAVADEINRSYDIQQNQVRGQATGAGAFGGSRAEIAEREIDRNRASALAQAQAQNFLNAQQQLSAQRARELSAGQGIGSLNIGAGETLARTALGQGEAFSNLGLREAGVGEVFQNLGQKETGFGFDLGERQRQLDQQTLDASRKSAIEEAYEPFQRIGFLSDIYKGAPTTQQSLTGASVPQASPFQQLVGGLTAVGSTIAGANKAGLFG